jgi:hypothetical protein
MDREERLDFLVLWLEEVVGGLAEAETDADGAVDLSTLEALGAEVHNINQWLEER